MDRGIKIGYSANPMKRAIELSCKTQHFDKFKNRTELVVLHAIPSDYVRRAESVVKKYFQHKRRPRKNRDGGTEWYGLSRQDYEWFKQSGQQHIMDRIEV